MSAKISAAGSATPVRRVVFLSYARRDGGRLALNLHDSLEAIGHCVWQDVFDMLGGDDWWLQIENQIKQADALLLIVTPSALESEVVRREWVQARREGIQILPVTDDQAIFQKTPRWMSKVDMFVLTPDSLDYQRKRLYEQLRELPPRRPVPFMAPSLPSYFAPRERDHRRLIGRILDDTQQNPSFGTVVVYGPPGFGKTTLMQDVCHDPAVLDAFTGGILWAATGEGGRYVLSSLNAVVTALIDRQVTFNTAEEAARRLNELLKHRDCLLVLDDVWDETHIKPFLGSGHCARFITTRDPNNCMPARAIAEPIGEMLTVEATTMLGGFLRLQGVDDISAENAREALSALARRLGEWPLLLNIFGGEIQKEITLRRASITQALGWIQQGLDESGLTAFDMTHSEDRNKALAASVSASLRSHSEQERQRLYELAIFRGNDLVPEHAAERLWAATASMTRFKARQLLREFAGVFFQLSLDRARGSNVVRFHDALREHLVDQLPEDRRREVHRAFLDSYNADGGPWYALKDDRYLFDRLAYHLSLAGQATQLYQLIDRAWMVRQLQRTGSNAAFLDDVDTAIAQARAEVPPNLVQVIRGVLAKASVGSFTSNLPPAMLAIVARSGQVQTARNHAAFILEKARKADAYRHIAEAMIAQGAAESIRQVLEEALLAVEQTADYGQRAQVMSELARTVARSGEPQWARQLVDEALELARRAVPSQQKSNSLAAIGAALVEIGDPTQALKVADELLTGARQVQQLGAYIGNVPVYAADARGLALGAYLLVEARERDHGIKVAGEAYTAARNILARIDPTAAVFVLCQVARVYHRAGDPVGSSRIADEACALAGQVQGAGAVTALTDAAGLYCELGRRADGVALGDRALAAAPNIADENGRMTALGQIASILLEAGEFARASDIAMGALNASSPIEAATSRTAALSQMAEALTDMGEIRRSTIIAVQALKSARAIPDQQTKVEAWSAIGGVLSRGETTEPDPAALGIVSSYEETAWVLFGMARERARRAKKDDAERAADKMLDVVDLIEDPFQRLNMVNNLGRMFAQLGGQETAARLFDQAVRRIADIGVEIECVYAFALIASSLAATGRTGEAVRLAENAQQSIANINDPAAQGRAQIVVAEALAKVGRYDEARTVMRSIQHFDDCLAASIAVARAMSDAGEFERVDALIKESGLDCPENWPELAQVEESLALSLAQKGNGESAVRCAMRVHPTRREHTLHSVSIALAERKDFVRAIEVANEIQVDGLRDSTLSSITSLLGQSDQPQQALTVAETIRTEGWKAIALARAAGHIARGGDRGRETAAPLVNQARLVVQRAVEDRLKLVALVEAAWSCHSLGDSQSFREILNSALSIAATGGRDQVFDVLSRSAGAMAELDRGQTLWRVWKEVEEVEGWWTTPPTAEVVTA